MKTIEKFARLIFIGIYLALAGGFAFVAYHFAETAIRAESPYWDTLDSVLHYLLAILSANLTVLMVWGLRVTYKANRKRV